MAERGRGGKRWGRGGGSPTTAHVSPSGEQKPKKSKEEQSKRVEKSRSDTSEPLDRLQYVNLNLLGHRVLVRMKDGQAYEGIYGGNTTEGGFGVILKFAHNLIVKATDFVELVAREVDFTLSAHTPERQRDTEISGGYDGGERELQRWTPEGEDPSLADTFGQTSSRGWDQFSVNEKLYGYQTTYREEIYTTELDKNSAAYRERIEHATRLANEIEKGTSRNIHVQEERGHIPTGGDEVDEEDRYGAVIRQAEARSSSEGKYVPPNKRAVAAAAATAASPSTAEIGGKTAEASAPIAIGVDKVTPPSSPLSSSPGSPKLHRRESDPKLNPLLAETMRVRQSLVKGKAATPEGKGKGGSPLTSPLVGDPVAIQSLALEVVPPKVSDEVLKKFEEYNARNRPNKEETIADLKKAKETLENSSPRLRSLSSSGGNPASSASPPRSLSSSQQSISSTASSSSVPPSSPSGAPVSPAVPSVSPTALKPPSKLNPNAKVFTPLSAKATPFVPKAAASATPPTPTPPAATSTAPTHVVRPHEVHLADIYNERAAQRLKAVHNLNDAPGAEHVTPTWPHGRSVSYKNLSVEEEQHLLMRQEYGRVPMPFMTPQALSPNSPQVIYVSSYGRAPYFVPAVAGAPLSPPAMIAKGPPRAAAAPTSPKGLPPGSPPYGSPQGVMMMGGYPQGQPMLVRPYPMPLDDLKNAKPSARPAMAFDPTQFEMDPPFQQPYMGRAHGAALPAFSSPSSSAEQPANAPAPPDVVHGFAVPNTDALPTQP